MDSSLSSTCRVIPGDAAWPSAAVWRAFNKTIGGRLIATVPIGAPCHQKFSNGASACTFKLAKCDDLRNVWYIPGTHLPSSSSPMTYPFSENSCNPWLSPDTPCILGGHLVYSVNATCYTDFQKTMSFAKRRNIRRAIRNTGHDHDYLGKSTDANAPAI